MSKPSKRAKIKAFIERRRINTLGLLTLTLLCILITVVCALQGFHRTDVLVVVCIGLVALCFVQFFKISKSFRKLKLRGLRKKQLHETADEVQP